jgi:hypothetical protein
LFAPKSPPPSVVFHVGNFLINGVATEPAAQPRLYKVRRSTDDDHPMIRDDREEALRKGFKCWYQHITITRLSDGRKWIFGEYTVGFPHAYEDSDAYALARLMANGRKRVRGEPPKS